MEDGSIPRHVQRRLDTAADIKDLQRASIPGFLFVKLCAGNRARVPLVRACGVT